MPRVVIPSNLDTRLYNTLRNMANELENTGSNIPLLKTLQQVRGIAEGTSAYLFVDGTLYRYNKVGGKLFREEVEGGEIPPYAGIIGDPIDAMPINVDPEPIIVTPAPPDIDPFAPAPPPPDITEIRIADIINDATGNIEVNLLEARDLSLNGQQNVPLVFLTVDGRLFYCGEGTYFNKILNLRVRVGDDTTRGETQRPTVEIQAPDTHSGEPFAVTMPFSRAVRGFEASEIQTTNATLSEFSGQGQTYKAVVTPTGTDDIRLLIPANIATDRFFLQNIASDRIRIAYQSPSLTPPSVGIFVPASYQGTTAFLVRVVFSETVTNFALTDIRVVGGTVSDFQTVGTTGRSYTAMLTPTGTGIITVNVPANVAQDTDGNGNTAAPEQEIVTVPTPLRNFTATTAEGQITVRWDAPASNNGRPILDYWVRIDSDDWINVGRTFSYVFDDLTNGQEYRLQGRARNDAGYSSVVETTATPTSQDTIHPSFEITAPTTYNAAFTVTITASETVLNFTQTDIGVVNGDVTAFAQSGTTTTATVTPTGTSTIQISIPAGAAEDTEGNESLASGVAVVVYQATASVPMPPRFFRLAAEDGAINAKWLPPRDTGGVELLGFDISLDGATAIQLSATAVNYRYSGLTNGQSYRVRILSRNSVGNSEHIEMTATPVAPTNVDMTPPVINIAGSPEYFHTQPFDVQIRATERVRNFVASDIRVINGTASNLNVVGIMSYQATITPTATADIEISIPAGVAEDLAGNSNLGSETTVVEYVVPPPTPNAPRNFRLEVMDRFIKARWDEPDNIPDDIDVLYGLRIVQGTAAGARWDYVPGHVRFYDFYPIANNFLYTIQLVALIRDPYSLGGGGFSTVLELTGTPTEMTTPDPGVDIEHPIVIDFDNDIIGDPEAEEQFWRQQGMSSTCAAVAVGSALASLGVVDDANQVVRDGTKIVDDRTGADAADIVEDEDGNIIRNTPTILSQGEALYLQPSTRLSPLSANRYRLGLIGWNYDVYPWDGSGGGPLLTTEEITVLTGWNGVRALANHYDVEHHTGYAYDFSWLIRELERGNKVIVFVDNRDIGVPINLRRSRLNSDPTLAFIFNEAQVDRDRVSIQPGNDTPGAQVGSRENHAVWITGIDLKDPSNPIIVINNSASGFAGTEYRLQQFLNGWEDAEFIYTALGSDELPDTPTIDGNALNREHRDLQRIIKLHRPDLLDITGLQTYPFFDIRFETDFLDMIGIRQRYETYLRHVALEQQRIVDAYGLDPDVFNNIIDVLQHE